MNRFIALCLTCIIFLCSCTIQMPRESQDIPDDRPTINVELPNSFSGIIKIDGLHIQTESVKAPDHLIRILSGKHRVEVYSKDNQALFDKVIYFAPNSHKTIRF